VHPPDSYAAENDSESGKTECWYVVYAKPAARIIRGLAPGTTPEEFRQALLTGCGIDRMLLSFEVQAGDFIFMPTGVVHAIGEGTIMLEIEQNSDMTYRLYDWDRLKPDGTPRPLHIDKGLDVTDFDNRTPARIEGLSYFEAGNRITHLASCRYFSVELLELESTYRVDTGGRSFTVLTVAEGLALVSGEGGDELKVSTGDTVFLPAEPPTSTVMPVRTCKIVKVYIDPTHRRFMEPLLRRGVGLDKIERHVFR